MLSENLSLGQLVKASCGISDGKSRKLDKPKLKKIKHLIVEKYVNEEIKMLLQNGNKITDSYIRAELNKLK